MSEADAGQDAYAKSPDRSNRAGTGSADWIAIREIIERKAPDIEVRIAVNGQPNSTTIRWQAKRPSLVFSPVILSGFSPRGGAVYCGRLFDKAKQLRRHSSIGISTPKSAEFYR